MDLREVTGREQSAEPGSCVASVDGANEVFGWCCRGGYLCIGWFR